MFVLSKEYFLFRILYDCSMNEWSLICAKFDLNSYYVLCSYIRTMFELNLIDLENFKIKQAQ